MPIFITFVMKLTEEEPQAQNIVTAVLGQSKGPPGSISSL